MASPSKTYPPADKLMLYDKLIAFIPGVEHKGATMAYTSLNGHMYSFLDKNGLLGLRLPKEIREEFIQRYKTSLCGANGTILKEYVAVPDSLLKKTKELSVYFRHSHNYVASLKPKPTRKK